MVVVVFFNEIDFFICVGVVTNTAQVPHVAVHAVISASVDTSTLPATVVLAFATTAQPSSSTQAHPTYLFKSPSATL